jgi:hypothetical protein
MPIPKNESEMEGHGWKKELTIKHIVIKAGVVYCEEWDYFADQIPCRIREGGTSGPTCGIDHTWITCISGNLFWSCFRHRIANGPISFEVGHKAKEYIIGATDALAICRSTNQTPPKEIVEATQSENAQKFNKRRRPNNK